MPWYLGSNNKCLVGVVPKKVKRKLLLLIGLKSFHKHLLRDYFNSVSSIINAFENNV